MLKHILYLNIYRVQLYVTSWVLYCFQFNNSFIRNYGPSSRVPSLTRRVIFARGVKFTRQVHWQSLFVRLPKSKIVYFVSISDRVLCYNLSLQMNPEILQEDWRKKSILILILHVPTQTHTHTTINHLRNIILMFPKHALSTAYYVAIYLSASVLTRHLLIFHDASLLF